MYFCCGDLAKCFASHILSGFMNKKCTKINALRKLFKSIFFTHSKQDTSYKPGKMKYSYGKMDLNIFTYPMAK